MSAKYTYFTWQMNIANPIEKLILLLLADYASESGVSSICLSEVCGQCSLTDIGLANHLTALADQGYIERVRRDGNGRQETLTFRLLYTLPVAQTQVPEREILPPDNFAPQPAQADSVNQSPTLPVYTMRDQSKNTFPASSQYVGSKRSEGNAISTYELDEDIIPTWAERAFRFSGIANEHTVVWRNFVMHHKARANELMTISRIESKLQNWLTNEKRYERQQTGRSATSGDGEKAKTARYQQKLSPSERFRQQVIQKGHKPKF